MKNRYSMAAFRQQGIDPREAVYLPRRSGVNKYGKRVDLPIVLDPRCGRAKYRQGKK